MFLFEGMGTNLQEIFDEEKYEAYIQSGILFMMICQESDVFQGSISSIGNKIESLILKDLDLKPGHLGKKDKVKPGINIIV